MAVTVKQVQARHLARALWTMTTGSCFMIYLFVLFFLGGGYVALANYTEGPAN